RYLLDTNVVIAVLAGTIDIEARQADGNAEGFIGAPTVGELFFGAEKSHRVEENKARIRGLAESIPLLPCDGGTALRYGRFRNELRLKGRPIPENDLWLAAIAWQHGLVLATRDGHFDYLDQLPHEFW